MNKSSTGIIATEFAQKVVDKGAGELIIRSISKDGMKDGFDIEAPYLKLLKRYPYL